MGFSWTTVAIVQLIQRQEKAFVREATSLCVSPSEPGQECCWCQFLLPHRHYDLSASIRMLSEVHGRTFLNFFCRTLIVCPKISSCYKPWLQHLKSMPAAQNWPSMQEPRRACSSWHSPTKSSRYWLKWEAKRAVWNHECLCRFAASTATHSQLVYKPRQTVWNLFPPIKSYEQLSVLCLCFNYEAGTGTVPFALPQELCF